MHETQPQPSQAYSLKDVGTIITLIITMVGAAVSFGVMYGKVERLDENNKEVSQSLQKTREELVEVKTQNKQFLEFLQDIKSDILIIKQKQEATQSRR